MFKKTIKYTDYNGVEREEDFLFNMTKAEVVQFRMSEIGGMENVINQIIKTQNSVKLMDLFKKIIEISYGEKSLDGKRFIKNKELTEAFTQTEAYSELFMELASDSDKASEFINGIMPKEISDAMNDPAKKEEIQKQLQKL